MTEALGTATGRFREPTGEMRGMTGQIQQELETTRAELSRGVVELPQETQETTANMRRVVADQIKALNELSTLVSRSNRAVDAAPRPCSRGASTSRPAARRVAAGRGRVPRRWPTRFAVRADSPRPAAARPTLPRRGRRRRRADGAAKRRLALRPPQPRLAGGRAAEPPAAGAPERAPRQPLDSLETISGDIARMIDHDAAVELWDRYKRGERNVFTRRLYTLQGQQTFDEIRRKYRRDASSGRPSTATWRSSSGFSRRRAGRPRPALPGPISPRTPARSTRCSPMRAGGSTS